MEKVIIFGADQFAELIFHFLKNDRRYQVCAFCVDAEYRDSERKFGLPVVEFEKVEKLFPPPQNLR
jgi:FlaA1/EpsC-like NDP-sugar epimerase